MTEITERWPLVRIRWLDSHGWHGWNSLSAVKEQHSLECMSVGWMVIDEADRVTLVAHIQGADADNPQCDGHMTIPRPAIIEVQKL